MKIRGRVSYIVPLCGGRRQRLCRALLRTIAQFDIGGQVDTTVGEREKNLLIRTHRNSISSYCLQSAEPGKDSSRACPATPCSGSAAELLSGSPAGDLTVLTGVTRPSCNLHVITRRGHNKGVEQSAAVLLSSHQQPPVSREMFTI